MLKNEFKTKEQKNSKNYNSIAWFIIIVGFILGIFFGNIFMKAELDLIISNKYSYTFNYGVMIMTWSISTLFGIIVMGIGSICHRLDLILEKN